MSKQAPPAVGPFGCFFPVLLVAAVIFVKTWLGGY